MFKKVLEGKWDQIKGQVQKQWGKLTDDDLAEVKGDSNILIGKIKERYGLEKEDAEKQVKDFFNSLKKKFL